MKFIEKRKRTGMQFQPRAKYICICDFDGFKEPEMLKKRPVIVIKANKQNSKLVTIVPISTTEPFKIDPLIHIPIDSPIDGTAAWIKCDMIYTVSITRLDKLKNKNNSNTKVSDEIFLKIKIALANYFSFKDN